MPLRRWLTNDPALQSNLDLFSPQKAPPGTLGFDEKFVKELGIVWDRVLDVLNFKINALVEYCLGLDTGQL